MLNVYLTFAGNAQEAIEFYKEALGATIEFSQTFADSPVEVPENWQDKIMHATLKADGFVLMFSDTMPGMEVTSGNQVNLNLNFSDVDSQTAVFNKLAEGGNITMPLEKQFWGARFGMLTDKFGVNWMSNCEMDA